MFVDAGYTTHEAVKASLGVRPHEETVRVLVLRGEVEIPSGYLFAAIVHWDGEKLTIYWPHIEETPTVIRCTRHPMFALAHSLGVDPTKAWYHGTDRQLAADAKFTGFRHVTLEE